MTALLIRRIVPHRLCVCVCDQIPHSCLSLQDVLFCPVVLIAVWLLVNRDWPLEDFKGFIDEYKTCFLLLIITGSLLSCGFQFTAV